MSNICSVTTRRAPFCPSCGEVAMSHSEYVEVRSGDTSPVLRHERVSLSWTCRCGFGVTVEASPSAKDGPAE